MKPTDPYTVDSPQIQRLAEVSLALQRSFLTHATQKVSRNNISLPQLMLLSHLSTGEPLNMSRLASLMNHTIPATTGLVDRLTRAGLVERHTVPNDCRQVLVKITQKGIELVNELKLDVATAIHEIRQTLPPEDREAWVRIYNAIHRFCLQKQKRSN